MFAAIGPGRYRATRAATSSKHVGASARSVVRIADALELEDPDRVAAAQHLVGALVVEGDVVDVGSVPGRLLDEVERRLDHRQVPQSEEVHLQQAERLDPVHLVLGDDRRVAGIGPGLGLALDRQVLGERLFRDDDGGGVDAVLAAQALEAPATSITCFASGSVSYISRSSSPRRSASSWPSTCVEAGSAAAASRPMTSGGIALATLSPTSVGLAEHPRRVAHRRPGLDRREGDDLGDVVPAVALGGVADHLGPVALVEVHVDVGHLLAAGVQEPLEEEVVADRVDVDDPQAVGDAAAGRRAPARPDADLRASGRGG